MFAKMNGRTMAGDTGRERKNNRETGSHYERLAVHIWSRKDMRSWSIITGVRPERLIS